MDQLTEKDIELLMLQEKKHIAQRATLMYQNEYKRIIDQKRPEIKRYTNMLNTFMKEYKEMMNKYFDDIEELKKTNNLLDKIAKDLNLIPIKEEGTETQKTTD